MTATTLLSADRVRSGPRLVPHPRRLAGGSRGKPVWLGDLEVLRNYSLKTEEKTMTVFDEQQARKAYEPAVRED
jgi:hypothetical protein